MAHERSTSKFTSLLQISYTSKFTSSYKFRTQKRTKLRHSMRSFHKISQPLSFIYPPINIGSFGRTEFNLYPQQSWSGCETNGSPSYTIVSAGQELIYKKLYILYTTIHMFLIETSQSNCSCSVNSCWNFYLKGILKVLSSIFHIVILGYWSSVVYTIWALLVIYLRHK